MVHATGETLRETAQEIFARSLERCSVAQAFARKVHCAAGARTGLELEGYGSVDLHGVEKIHVVAAGKAAGAMLTAMLDRLPEGCPVEGVLIAPTRPADLHVGIRFFAGGHPLPNEDSFVGARTALAMLQRAARESGAFCVFLISGGASSMMELPLDPAISLEETIAFHRGLVHSGASIAEINCVRKHFSAVKGGRLALAAGVTPNLSLLLSDVPVGHLDALGSGPTLPDSSTVEQCQEIIARYRLLEQWPVAVGRFFESAELAETPKATQLQSRAFVLLASDDLAEAAVREAEQRGFYSVVDNTCDDWEYREAAHYLVGRLRELRKTHSRVCIVSAGELTVKVSEAAVVSDEKPRIRLAGLGGRNQHFALYAATLLAASDRNTVILSAGSDGVDGNSAAAGAVVDETMLVDVREEADRVSDLEEKTSLRRKEAEIALEEFDSSRFLARFGATVVTGPTGNNLRDLRILLAE